MRPSEVRVWTSEGHASQLVRELGACNFDFPVNIRAKYDCGPGMKLIYELPNDSPIITVDDDVLYRHSLVEDLVQSASKNPGSIISDRVHRVAIDPSGVVEPYSSWQREIENPLAPSYLNFPTGVGGVLYPPGSLHLDAGRVDLYENLARATDDIWWWIQALRADTKIVNTGKFQCMEYVSGTQSVGLWQTGNRVRNDLVLKDLLRRFSLYQKLAT